MYMGVRVISFTLHSLQVLIKIQYVHAYPTLHVINIVHGDQVFENCAYSFRAIFLCT